MNSNDEFPITHDVVLVGGGHSHVEVIRQFAMRPEPGVRVTLVSRDVHTPYSGMLPGLLAGHYSFDEAHINLHRFCHATGVRFVHAEVTGVDAEVGRLSIERRPSVAFDVVSFDTGSKPKTRGIDGVEYAIAVKPVDEFRRRWQQFEQTLSERNGTANITIVGAGAGGVELTLSLQSRLKKITQLDQQVAFTICTAGDDILVAHSPSVASRFRRVLKERGVEVITGERVKEITNASCVTETGRQISSDAVILVTGAQSADWYADSHLATDDRGFVLVHDTLQSTSHDNVFASGDCASLRSHSLPKAGVYAVRQGAVLAENLRARARGVELQDFDPQARILALISTGDHYAVASRGAFSVEGGWVWRWKNWIDRRWMERYQNFEMKGAVPTLDPPASQEDGIGTTAMRCGGCGAKVPASTLRTVLSRIATSNYVGESVSIGLEQADDAAVIDVPAGSQLVQSVDHFRSFIDDPWRFALITTNHCLNDLFAMGAKPSSALATVIVPHGAAGPVAAELEALLRGAIDGLKSVDATLVGGHSAEGCELSFGLTVNGLIGAGQALGKNGWQDGDRLILNKALGSGVILAADMRAHAPFEVVEAALQNMQLSNANAVDVYRRHNVSACTDVTGFGVYGHAMEMAKASRIGARLDLGRLPLLSGVAELIEQGFESTLAPSNRSLLDGAGVVVDGKSSARYDILFDPQTAGGLLAAVPASMAQSCIEQLQDAGYSDAVEIGHVSNAITAVELVE